MVSRVHVHGLAHVVESKTTIAGCPRWVRSKTFFREKQQLVSYWPPSPPKMFSIVCALRYKNYFNVSFCTYIHFSHFTTKNENETWKAVKLTFYALPNVVLRLIHFSQSEGQATRVSKGQQHYFYTKRLETCRRCCKVKRDFLYFYSWDETSAKYEPPKSEEWLYSVLLVC